MLTTGQDLPVCQQYLTLRFPPRASPSRDPSLRWDGQMRVVTETPGCSSIELRVSLFHVSRLCVPFPETRETRLA